MDVETFQNLFREHRAKISQAWIKLADDDLKGVGGDLEKFLDLVNRVYKVPREVVLKELDAVKKNIDTGTKADFAPRLDPRE